ncbi:MAG: DUF4230 domain-containing protein [Clostridia bacterium]|nr:DUF4230 domain-containing protein [Clostridia bacterium]
MKTFLRWLAKLLTTAAAVLLTIVLLPYASDLMTAYLPDLSGAARNISVTLSRNLQETGRLEVMLAQEEGVLESSTEALFLGTVQKVSVQYIYRASVGIDLTRVQVKVQGRVVTLLLPEPEILNDSLEPGQIVRDDFWYPLTDTRLQKLIEDEKLRCRSRYLSEQADSSLLWDYTVSALSNTVAQWLGVHDEGVTIRYERLADSPAYPVTE